MKKTTYELSIKNDFKKQKNSFSGALKPFIDYAYKKLDTLYFNDPSWFNIKNTLIKELENKLLVKITPSLVLELNIARVKGELRGNNQKKRFNYFCHKITNKKFFLLFIKQYPILAQLLSKTTLDWIDAISELLDHLKTDCPQIKKEFPELPKCPILKYLTTGLSDTHKNGRTVCKLTFISGKKIIYKPKSLQVDLHFQNFLQWLNKHGTKPNFPKIKIINRNLYGWEECVNQKECKNICEVKQFYQRQGGYLAILYILNGTDIHRENLIAAGKYPILIDLETIFNNSLPLPKSGGALKESLKLYDDSVMKIGLLPSIDWYSEDAIDYSGLNGKSAYATVKQWKNKYSDEMHLGKGRKKIKIVSNELLLNGKSVDFQMYVEDIIKGFRNTYKILMGHQRELINRNGPIYSFAKDIVRQVFRPTRSYQLYIEKGHHPDNLQNISNRKKLMNHLWIKTNSQPKLAIILNSEKHDLLKDNIPIFTSKPNSLNIYDSKNKCFTNFFKKNSLSAVIYKIRNLNQKDLNRQIWFIHTSLAMSDKPKHYKVLKKVKKELKAINYPKNKFSKTAIKIGHQLIKMAVKTGPEIMWIGPTLLPNEQLSLMPIGYDLYGGTAGIALFLGYLGKETQNKYFMNISRAAIYGARKQIFKKFNDYENILPSSKLISPGGGFLGTASVIYAMSHLGSILNDKTLIHDALIAAKSLKFSIEKDKRLDVLGGLAGCILVLISLYTQTREHDILNLATQCGKILIKKSKLIDGKRIWSTPFPTNGPLSGFSHGNAGFAYSLLKLWSITLNKQFQKAAWEALSYEKTLYSKKNKNWEDLRIGNAIYPSTKLKKFSVAWCNGSPGIALARLLSLDYLEKNFQRNYILEEIKNAISTTLTHGFKSNHSLCHGAFGNLETLLVASNILKDKILKNKTAKIAINILNDISRNDFKYGTPNNIETQGLMTGLAGIGLGLLRVKSPEKIPSILGLEPPKK